MPILIPATFFATLLLLFVAAGRGGFRQSFLHAATVYTLCLVCATEALSIWSLLRLPALLSFWTACALISAACLRRWGDRRTTRGAWQRAGAAFRTARPALLSVAAILAAVLVVALVAPPNNWESMNYRMTRVVMWMQQGGVAHYPTGELIQLFYPPLAEYNILHFQVLSGGDRFANTVHWFALAGCGILASLVAKALRQEFPVQVLAAVIAVTLPMGLIQGSSTQGNLLVAFWLLAFTVFVLQYFTKPSTVRLVCCGLAFGFALLSKGTAYTIAPPLAVTVFLHAIVRAESWRPRLRLAGAGAVTLMVALSVNGGHYWRNWNLFGHPLHSESYHKLNFAIFEPRVLTSALVRNAALHWGVPSEKANEFTFDVVRQLFGDPLLSIPGTHAGTPFLESGIPFGLGESAGNFLHFWFLSTSLAAILLFRRRLRFEPWTVCLALAVTFAAVFFCGSVVWEQWNSRYHTPLFMLGAPLAAAFTARLPTGRGFSFLARPPRCRPPVRGRRGVTTGMFVLLSLPWVTSNDLRPLYPAPWTWQIGFTSSSPSILSRDRARMYFNAYTARLFSPYDKATDALAAFNPQEVGIIFMERTAYYPIWVFLNDKMNAVPRLEYVAVPNASRTLRAGFSPSAVIAVGARSAAESSTRLAGNESIDVFSIKKGMENSILLPIHSWDSIAVLRPWSPRFHLEQLSEDSEVPLQGSSRGRRLPRITSAGFELVARSVGHDVYIDRERSAVLHVRNGCQPPAVQDAAAPGAGRNGPAPAAAHPAEPVFFLDLVSRGPQKNLFRLEFAHASEWEVLLNERCIAIRVPLPPWAVVPIGTYTSDTSSSTERAAYRNWNATPFGTYTSDASSSTEQTVHWDWTVTLIRTGAYTADGLLWDVDIPPSGMSTIGRN